MRESFNPFIHWLGMQGNAPANYYELLQLPTFENDVAVIAQAAQRLTTHLQSISPGPYVNERQALLDQIYAALACLLDSAAKSRYDAALHGPVQWTGSTSSPPQSSPPLSPPPQDPTPWTPSAPPIASPPVQRPEPLARQDLYGAIPLPQQLSTPPLRTSKRNGSESSVAGLLLFVLALAVGALGVAAALFLITRLSLRPSPVTSRLSQTEKNARQPSRPTPVSNEDNTSPDKSIPSLPKTPTDNPREVSKEASRPGTPSPASKADPSPQNPVKDALRQAYAAMAERKLSDAEGFLKIARENVQTDEQTTQVRRAAIVYTHLGEFWRVINAKIKAIQPLDELAVADTRVVVASVDAQVLTIKAEGRVHRYSMDALPGWVVTALADVALAKDPASKTIFATFLAVDSKGDRDHAKRLFAEAAQAGVSVQNCEPDLEFLLLTPR